MSWNSQSAQVTAAFALLPTPPSWDLVFLLFSSLILEFSIVSNSVGVLNPLARTLRSLAEDCPSPQEGALRALLGYSAPNTHMCVYTHIWKRLLVRTYLPSSIYPHTWERFTTRKKLLQEAGSSELLASPEHFH